MPRFAHDGLAFRYRDSCAGVPFVFQHGLGSDGRQPFDLCGTLDDVRLLALDCRAHGGTTPIGPEEKIGLKQSADDLSALLDELEIERAVIGGVSMWAAIALSFAITYPGRVAALVLSRPAWLDQPLPPNLADYPVIARLIRTHGPAHGLEEFRSSERHRELEQAYPASAESLRLQFAEPRAAEAVVRLERIPGDAPAGSGSEWAAINVPTLVLANREDFIHPFSYGTALAEAIPGAAFCELTPKAVSAAAHVAYQRAAIRDFLATARVS